MSTRTTDAILKHFHEIGSFTLLMADEVGQLVCSLEMTRARVTYLERALVEMKRAEAEEAPRPLPISGVWNMHGEGPRCDREQVQGTACMRSHGHPGPCVTWRTG